MTHECGWHRAWPVAPDETRPPVGAGETVGDVARRYAGALETMQEMGINHCCGAHLTLREAAASAGVPLDALLAALSEPARARA
jgi:iron-sulfur cluster repair protein YtfE (RIC family)